MVSHWEWFLIGFTTLQPTKNRHASPEVFRMSNVTVIVKYFNDGVSQLRM